MSGFACKFAYTRTIHCSRTHNGKRWNLTENFRCPLNITLNFPILIGFLTPFLSARSFYILQSQLFCSFRYHNIKCEWFSLWKESHSHSTDNWDSSFFSSTARSSQPRPPCCGSNSIICYFPVFFGNFQTNSLLLNIIITLVSSSSWQVW